MVAQDAAFEHNREVLAEISRRGHDIGNHTFHHDPWLHIYSEEEINAELALAEDHIKR
ncbi:MAG: polysaccharide deacetylase family protein [Bacteroidia bacterium]